jgi:phosphoglycolate phosphatase
MEKDGARRQGWIAPESRVSLVGDHENDIRAARATGIQAVAVATGLTSLEDLAACAPDILLPDLQSLQLDMVL